MVKNDAVSQARRARRPNRNNSATTSIDETRVEGFFFSYVNKNFYQNENVLVPETRLKPPTSRQRRRSSPKDSVAPPVDESTTVTIENETKPRRKKKTFKAREGEDIEMAVKKRGDSHKKKHRTKSKEPQSENETRIDPNRDKILGIIIHRTDRLRTDLRLRHPLVRVHIIDIATRSYVHKTTAYVKFKILFTETMSLVVKISKRFEEKKISFF